MCLSKPSNKTLTSMVAQESVPYSQSLTRKRKRLLEYISRAKKAKCSIKGFADNLKDNKSLAISNLLRVGVKNLCCPSKEKVCKSLDKTIFLMYNTPVINKISVPKTASVVRLNFLPRLKIS